MFGQVTNDENKFFISEQEILGIQNLELSYAHSYSPTRFVGIGSSHALVSSSPQHSLSLSRYLIYSDPVIDYTGESPISGSLHYQEGSYGFTSGFLTDYSVNCAVGSVPAVNSAFTIYGDLETGYSASGSAAPISIHIPNQGSISLTCDNSTTNRVVGFDYAIKIPRNPIYKIGSRFPSEVITPLGLEFSASVQIDVDDAFAEDSKNFLLERENKNVLFTIKSRDLSTTLQQLIIPNASLISERISSSADGGVKLTLNYVGQT